MQGDCISRRRSSALRPRTVARATSSEEDRQGRAAKSAKEETLAEETTSTSERLMAGSLIVSEMMRVTKEGFVTRLLIACTASGPEDIHCWSGFHWQNIFLQCKIISISRNILCTYLHFPQQQQ